MPSQYILLHFCGLFDLSDSEGWNDCLMGGDEYCSVTTSPATVVSLNAKLHFFLIFQYLDRTFTRCQREVNVLVFALSYLLHCFAEQPQPKIHFVLT